MKERKRDFPAAVRLWLVVLTLLGLTSWTSEPRAAGEELVVIVNSTTSVQSLSKGQLARLFKARSRNLESGVQAVPVNLPKQSDQRKQFDEVALDLSPDEVERYWIDQKIRDGSRPPPSLSTEAAVLRHVQQNKGGVGYVSADVVEGSVRVVARIRGDSVVAP